LAELAHLEKVRTAEMGLEIPSLATNLALVAVENQMMALWQILMEALGELAEMDLHQA
jgi:hypothetical protein